MTSGRSTEHDAGGTRHWGACGLVLLALCLAGCPVSRDLAPEFPCSTVQVERTVNVREPQALDVLFVIDDSASMADEQRALRVQVPRLIRALTEGDRDLDGFPDYLPVDDLHVGVVRTDMGTGPFVSEGCPGGRGADGVLVQTAGAVPGAQCDSAYPPFLAFPDVSDTAALAEDVQCLSAVGTAGCSFEQPLEAMLKALTPSTAGPVFVGETVGHGDGANAGFSRPDAGLVVVILTDEDDCSSGDDALYDPAGSVYPGPFAPGNPGVPLLDRRCAQFRAAQYPLDRYVDGLAALDTRFVVFAVIAGVPPEAVDEAEGDLEVILDHPDMRERVDPDAIASLVPACVRQLGTITQQAAPARRLVQVARRLEAEGVGDALAESICAADANGEADYTAIIDALLDRVSGSLGGSCIRSPLRRLPNGEVLCEVEELLPSGRRCEELAGRALLGTEGDRERCSVAQLPVTVDEFIAAAPPPGDGWFYDDYTPLGTGLCAPGHVRLTEPGPPSDTEVSIRCRVDTLRRQDGRADDGTACAVGGGTCALDEDGLRSLRHQYAREDAELFCEPTERVCRLRCRAPADCPVGFACAEAGADSYCVDPTCR